MRSTQRQTSGAALAARSGAPPRKRTAITAVLPLALLAVVGCDGLTKNDQLPTDVTDPAITQTPEGALQVYHGVVVQFLGVFSGAFYVSNTVTVSSYDANVVAVGAELTDELQYVPQSNSPPSLVDQRNVQADGTNNEAAPLYSGLQKVRGQTSQAIGLLHDYLPDSMVLTGHAYTLAGYAEVFLAELFCSGIPLSTLDYRGNYTPKPGSSTTEVLTHAAGLFDSALKYAGNNATVMDLARLGKARALLGMGDYDQAAATAGVIADGFTYATSSNVASNFVGNDNWLFSIPNREGLSGLDYVSSGDPRTVVQNVDGRMMPAKYAPFDGTIPIVVASGLEARLIEAEAALQKKDYPAWLDKLNYLRQTEAFWGQIVPRLDGPLPLLDDPGPDVTGGDSLRVDLLFRERAFWLFLTGHRQGDLRRLLRQYGRRPEEVYPIGPYYLGGTYGSTVMLPIPIEERQTNPLFTGCASGT